MSIEKDIQRLFEEILSKHGGNKAAVAAKLGINSVTFWGWATGKRKPVANAVCKAIDNAGGKLLLPGEYPVTPVAPAPEPRETAFLVKEIDYLKRENALLSQLLEKYKEGERANKENPNNRRLYTDDPELPAENYSNPEEARELQYDYSIRQR